MLGARLNHQSQADLTRDFGADFAHAVAALPVGVWSAPIASAQGLHLVRVLHANAQQQPEFESV